MALTAEQAKAKMRLSELEAEVRAQLQRIDQTIAGACGAWGSLSVSYALPLLRHMPGVSQEDAQRYVYSHVVKSLVDRGYGVLLAANKLTVQFESGASNREIQAMDALLKKAAAGIPFKSPQAQAPARR